MGEKTCVFVVPREGAEPSLDGIITHMSAKNVAKFKLPERMETIAALPRNPVGKILKRELREKLTADS